MDFTAKGSARRVNPPNKRHVVQTGARFSRKMAEKERCSKWALVLFGFIILCSPLLVTGRGTNGGFTCAGELTQDSLIVFHIIWP